ncbi:MAG: hypothetical protein KKE20_00565 [Nanoarchaeota archaeon]|nr:hypothetical protein [Nanoarchaeota archaeon]
MKRKVIKQGNGTLTITLPKGWTKKVGLTGNSEVDVEDMDNGLAIRTRGASSKKKMHLELESNNQIYLNQILSNIYLSGYDEVDITLLDSKSIAHINKALDNLLGYQIIEQTKNICHIKDISPVTEEQFPTLLRRTFLLVKSMFSALLDDLNNSRLDNMESVREISKTVHKFVYYCRRTITKKHLFEDYESTRMYMLLNRLLTTCHSINYVYDSLSERKKIKIGKECADYAKKAYDYYNLFYDLYYSRKLKDLPRLSIIKHEMLHEKMPEMIKKNSEDNIIIHYIADIVRETAKNGGILFTLKEGKS